MNDVDQHNGSKMVPIYIYIYILYIYMRAKRTMSPEQASPHKKAHINSTTTTTTTIKNN